MITPDELREYRNSEPPVSDKEIERITDRMLKEAPAGEEIVFVAFDSLGSARRCKELYSAHYECTVNAANRTTEIRIPRPGEKR